MDEQQQNSELRSMCPGCSPSRDPSRRLQRAHMNDPEGGNKQGIGLWTVQMGGARPVVSSSESSSW
ncbi:hypothetical protein I79_019308 [Cricetulus griseus]|uniref:Uncharacterized protein n=1 Tax=Cricetulus griseus TaxID=10029 RepID=G3I727_CRIGR|nr:hypothetical protein I79_019308 [Cricetulus griseus]